MTAVRSDCCVKSSSPLPWAEAVLQHLVMFFLRSAETKPVTSGGPKSKWLITKLGYFRPSAPSMHLTSFHFLLLPFPEHRFFFSSYSHLSTLCFPHNLSTINCFSPPCSFLATQIYATGLFWISVHCNHSSPPSESIFSASLIWTNAPLSQGYSLMQDVSSPTPISHFGD